MTQELHIGDIVRHAILETDKIIVGIGKDRYLCVHLEDVDPGGRLRPNSRVAMHRGIHLERVGYRKGVAEVNLGQLYQQEAISKHFFFKQLLGEEILINGLFILAAVLILMALFTGIDYFRRQTAQSILKKVEVIEAEYRNKIKNEVRQRQQDE